MKKGIIRFMHEADVLLIMVSTNDGPWLASCFEALAASSFRGFDTLLVVNACTDDSEARARESRLDIEIVRTESACGAADANNIGVRRGLERGYRYAFFLNPDTRVHPDAIGCLKGFLDQNPSYGIAGSQQIDYESPGWHTPNHWTREALDGAQLAGSVPRRMGEWSVMDHFYVQGAALMLRLGLVPRIGMFDPAYDTFFEETDLCRRCVLAGSRVGIVFDSRVKHFEGGNWNRSARDHLRRDTLLLRNHFLYALSGCETGKEAVKVGTRLLARHLKWLHLGGQELSLPVWRYPGVLVDVLRHGPVAARLRRRNLGIRAGVGLPASEYAIGESSRQFVAE